MLCDSGFIKLLKPEINYTLFILNLTTIERLICPIYFKLQLFHKYLTCCFYPPNPSGFLKDFFIVLFGIKPSVKRDGFRMH